MLRKSMKFRHEREIDKILDNSPKILHGREGYMINDFIAKLPVRFRKDHNNLPIMYSRFGMTHFQTLVKYVFII